ncbi:PhoX family protein, partial [Streptomyces sp. NPDC058642]|uniref:PhoX family protein n=1 Tax=Streptomyces sp. NPDC058642 TaxID=3346572 RepID=UPI003669A509
SVAGAQAVFAAPRAGAGGPGPGGPSGTSSGAVTASPFRAVAATTADDVAVPPGFRADVLARWGDALTRTTGEDADQQARVGSHHHGAEFLPLTTGKGLLALTHEAAPGTLPGADGARLAMSAQGVTVAAVRQDANGAWSLAGSRFNRRLTADTPVRLSGPAGGRDGRGVLAPGATGVTPWDTLLIAEENANAAYGTSDPDWRRDETAMRYGFSAHGFGAAWHTADARFDLADKRSRPMDHGWITELDPHAPASAPVKRTALGRFWHGCATVTQTDDGRVVVYSTDAEDGEYLYRFVSAAPWRLLRRQGRDPLDHGTLYVARFGAFGDGRWLPLVFGTGSLTTGNGWRDQADVLLRTRLAADAVGATPLARPERVAVHPRTGEVYLALVGGTACGTCAGHTDQDASADRATGTGRGTGRYGRILRWTESGASAAATDGFAWEVFLSGGDPALTSAGVFAAPKNLWFDADGRRLWISTGIPGHSLADSDDLVFARVGNNALLAADPRTGKVARFLIAPRGAEVTGVSATGDGDTLFVNIQHPGQRTRAWGSPTALDPCAVSHWPDGAVASRPRSATVAVRRA